MTHTLLIIDPQNDFCTPQGALFVPGADADMNRLSDIVLKSLEDSEKNPFNDIIVTLDTHHVIDIGHPGWWTDANGNSPNPFTLIPVEDVLNDVWTPRFEKKDVAVSYLRQLEEKNRFVHTVWPEHCILGTFGHALPENLNKALNAWTRKTGRQIQWVFKGMNPNTEHYSAVKAEVTDPKDPHTVTNVKMLDTLRKSDQITIAGEALSHCVKATVEDVISEIQDLFGMNIVPKMTLLKDCMSSVPAIPNGPNFPKIGQDFLDTLKEQGATIR